MDYLCEFFSDSKIHDYQLESVCTNYKENYIDLKFIDTKNQLRNIRVNNFIVFSIFRNEMWGKGNYVVASDCDIYEGGYTIEIQLNSGDKCIIRCRGN